MAVLRMSRASRLFKGGRCCDDLVAVLLYFPLDGRKIVRQRKLPSLIRTRLPFRRLIIFYSRTIGTDHGLELRDLLSSNQQLFLQVLNLPIRLQSALLLAPEKSSLLTL